MLGYLSVLNLCGPYSYFHSFWVHMCINPIVLFPPNFPWKSCFTFFSFTFSPGLSAPHYAIPLLAPDLFQQVLKGNCNSFTLKNMYNYITERKKDGAGSVALLALAENPNFIHPPKKKTHTCAFSDSQLTITQFQGIPAGMHVAHICECKQKMHTHTVELIFKITDIKGFD